MAVAAVVSAAALAILSALVVLFAGGAFAARAYAAENQAVVVSAADARIVEDAPTTNYGRSTTVQVDGDDPGGTGMDKSGLIRWDLSGVPAGSKISSASVTVNVTDASGNTYQAYALKRPWAEAATTWNLFDAASPWEVAGAKGSLDRAATVAGSLTPSATGKHTFSLAPEVVQRWADDPASNRGIVIANETNKDGFAFNSRDHSDAALRPQLTVAYGAADTTPPETTIDSGPSGTVSSSSASFAFSSSEAGSTFECSLDGSTFGACASPKEYAGLSDGSHAFRVRATDAAGNQDATPAERSWTVGTATPAQTRSFASTADARISENSPTNKYGAATTVQVDGDNPDGSGKDESGLLRWDLSGIASGTPIATASVTLNVTNASGNTYQAYALKRPWTEAAASWNLYAASSPWEVAGAKGPLDRAAEIAGSLWPSTTGTQTFSLSPDMVQRWVDDPSANRGIVIANETNADGLAFSSRESADPALRPRLTVTTWGTPKKDDAVLAGAGDVHASCSSNTDDATANLLDGIAGTVFTLGDNTNNGTAAQFENCYGPSWGRHKARTLPGIGNHEYDTGTASAYFDYFGEAAGDPTKGYYSYDRGEWHVVVLNSVCENVGGCVATSPMLTWLKQDLAANPTRCTLVQWHSPIFSSGPAGSLTKMKPAYRILYDNNADVLLVAHDRIYERFAPQDPNGAADPERGIREFVVGTGGGSSHAFGTVKPNSEVRNNDTQGVLKMTLKADGYEWGFVPVAGKSFTDSGSAGCH